MNYANCFESFSARKKPVPYQRVKKNIFFKNYYSHCNFFPAIFSAHLHGVHLAQQKALTLHGEAILVHPVCNAGVLQAVRLVALVLVLAPVLALVLAITQSDKASNVIDIDHVLTLLAIILPCLVYHLVLVRLHDLPVS